MHILITGANGQVGHEIKKHADNKRYAVTALAKQDLDISSQKEVTHIFKSVNPQFVINAAAYTKVDLAEDEVEAAFLTNSEGAKNLAVSCAQQAIPLIHLSTDYIFDGKKHLPYLETDDANPINVYGKSKLEGEIKIRQYCAAHIILRVSGVFGNQGNNFVKTILKLGETQRNLKIIHDQYISPTPAPDIAKAIWKMVAVLSHKPAWGTYHLTGGNATNWYLFATKILEQLSKYKKIQTTHIQAISSSEYVTRAPRPTNAILNCDQLKNVFGIQTPCWEDALIDVIKNYVASSDQ